MRSQTNGANARRRQRAGVLVPRPLVAVRDLDQRRLAARRAPERDRHRQAGGQPGRHGEQRVAGDGRGAGARAGVRLGVDQVDRAGRGVRRRHQRVELVRPEHGVDARPPGRGPGSAPGPSAYSRLPTVGPGQRPLEQRLPEVRELDVGVLAVEGDHVGQRARSVARAGREVVAQAGLELGQHHQQLVAAVGLGERQVDVVDDRGALRPPAAPPRARRASSACRL